MCRTIRRLSYIETKRLPDVAALREPFAPDPAVLPEVVINLVSLSTYDALLVGGAA